MPVKRFGHAGAGVERATGRSIADVRDRRRVVINRRILLHRHDVFHQQRPGIARLADVLVPNAPAAVRPFDEIKPFGGVAVIGVVVAGEKVAVVVEAELLRIAQAGAEKLEVGAVGVAAEDAAGVRVIEEFALLGLYGKPSIPAGEVEFAVRPEAQAVKIVALKIVAHAVTGGEDLPFIADACAFGIAQHVEAGNVAEVNVPFALEHPGGDAVQQIVEALGPDDGVIASPAARAIFQQPNTIGIFRQLLPAIRPVPLHHRRAIFNRAAGKILIHPRIEVADIEHAAVPKPMALHDPDAPVPVDAHRDRIHELRLRSPHARFEILGQLEVGDGFLGVVPGDGGRRILRRRWSDRRRMLGRTRCARPSQRKQTQRKSNTGTANTAANPRAR